MVWKSDFFSWFMRFVRFPPYENWAFWTNFYFSWENGEFFWGQTCCTLFHTKNEEKSQKISTCIRIHTRIYAITWWWAQRVWPEIRTPLEFSRGPGNIQDPGIFQGAWSFQDLKISRSPWKIPGAAKTSGPRKFPDPWSDPSLNLVWT